MLAHPTLEAATRAAKLLLTSFILIGFAYVGLSNAKQIPNSYNQYHLGLFDLKKELVSRSAEGFLSSNRNCGHKVSFFCKDLKPVKLYRKEITKMAKSSLRLVKRKCEGHLSLKKTMNGHIGYGKSLKDGTAYNALLTQFFSSDKKFQALVKQTCKNVFYGKPVKFSVFVFRFFAGEHEVLLDKDFIRPPPTHGVSC